MHEVPLLELLEQLDSLFTGPSCTINFPSTTLGLEMEKYISNRV
jgi:hypothetical protein